MVIMDVLISDVVVCVLFGLFVGFYIFEDEE